MRDGREYTGIHIDVNSAYPMELINMAKSPTDPSAPRVNRATRNLVGIIKGTLPLLREATAECDITAIKAHASAIATNASKLATVAAQAIPVAPKAAPAAPAKK